MRTLEARVFVSTVYNVFHLRYFEIWTRTSALASRESLTPTLRGMINRFWEKVMTVLQWTFFPVRFSLRRTPCLFVVTRTWKGIGGHDFIPDRALEMLSENFLVYVRFELFLNNFWNSSTILLCFVFIRSLFEYSYVSQKCMFIYRTSKVTIVIVSCFLSVRLKLLILLKNDF